MTTHNPTNPTSPRERTRTDAAVAWTVWHAGELVAVGVPLLLALLISWWFVLLAVLTGAAWAVREVRTTSTAPAAGSAGTPPAALAPADHRADRADTNQTDQQTGDETRKGATA